MIDPHPEGKRVFNRDAWLDHRHEADVFLVTSTCFARNTPSRATRTPSSPASSASGERHEASARDPHQGYERRPRRVGASVRGGGRRDRVRAGPRRRAALRGATDRTPSTRARDFTACAPW